MRALLALLVGIILFSCAPARKEPPYDAKAHQAEVDAWHQHRLEELKADDGWLNLVGLFWLKDGINTFGSGPKNDLVFPYANMPAQAGYLLLKSNTVELVTLQGVKVKVDTVETKKAIIFHPDSSRNPRVAYQSLRWNIIKRSDKLGVRLRDLESPAVRDFRGIERFPVTATYKLPGRFIPGAPDLKIPITNVLGQVTPTSSPGKVEFTWEGKSYVLDVLDGGPEELYLIFGDDTNTKETYGAGRFLYIPRADSAGNVVIDFNKSYNPPCAFTEFATCPLPPRQNVLPIAIRAGEKNYGAAHGE